MSGLEAARRKVAGGMLRCAGSGDQSVSALQVRKGL